VAHDFNNLLTAIQGNAEFALAELAPGTQPRADVVEIYRAAERAAALTRQLLAFSRKQVLRPRVVELDAVVADVEKLLRRVIGEDVRLVTAPAAHPQRVLADPGQLEQVLVNLAVNARDAMPDGGTLTLSTGWAALDELPEAVRRPTLGAGAAVLRVTDTGVGMDAGTRTRAFEPFFTTKPEGQGTGIGLATVYGIAEQSGGAVWIESAPGAGTTVSLALPAVSHAEAASQPAGAADTAAGGEGTVLLVEDDAAVRLYTERVLRRSGYEVLAAADGQAALAAWADTRRRGGVVDAIVTDVVMPGVGGPAFVRRLRRAHPDLRVLFVSGYVEGGLSADDLGQRTAFLAKPFASCDLLARLAELLA
jgi:CheY-like chemotaxis protein